MKKTLFLFLTLIIIFFFLDRLLYFLKPTVYKYSRNLGWETKENYRNIFREFDNYGYKYEVDYETDSFGARTLLSDNSEYTILVIGDSFTMDPHTSNRLSWFGIVKSKLEKELNKKISLYAIGGGGYGTNQQYLKTLEFLKKSKINPDMVLMQFCINDFMNNSYEWEIKTENYNQYLRRPYFRNDSHFFYHTSFFSKIIRNEYFSYLKSPNYILMIAGLVKQKYFVEEIDNKIKQNSVEVTKVLITKLRNLFNTENYFIFNCKEGKEYPENIWDRSLSLINVIILNKPSIEMKKKEKNEAIFFRDRGHYNELGNEYLGNLVFLDIIKHLK